MSDASVVELSGKPHPEQLIGTTREISGGRGKPKTRITIKGYYGAKCALHDEAQSVLNEEREEYSQIQRIKRQAMDCYGNNLLDKKLVSVTFSESLRYCPETIMTDFMHPVKLSSKYFTTGSYRRYEACLNFTDTASFELSDGVAGLFETAPNKNEELTQEFKQKFEENTAAFYDDYFQFDEVSKNIIAHACLNFQQWLLNYPNPKIRRYGELTLFTMKDHFVKLSLVAQLARGVLNPKLFQTSPEITLEACKDAVQFQLETIKNYCEYGDIANTSDDWHGAQGMDITALEWLLRKGAISEKTSDISVRNFTSAIMDLHGIQERQAKGKVSQLKKDGLIDTSGQGKQNAVVWLKIQPKSTSIITAAVDWAKVWGISQEDLKGGLCNLCKDMPSIFYFLYAHEPSKFSFFLFSYNKGDRSNAAQVAQVGEKIKSSESKDAVSIAQVAQVENKEETEADRLRKEKLDEAMGWGA